MNEARDGLHNGAEAWARIKVTPRLASLSRLGVFVCGCPFIGPIQSFKSSEMMRRMLGFFASAAGQIVDAEKLRASTARTCSERKQKYFMSIGRLDAVNTDWLQRGPWELPFSRANVSSGNPLNGKSGGSLTMKMLRTSAFPFCPLDYEEISSFESPC